MRSARVKRKTKETNVLLSLNLDGKGDADIKSPIGFLNHMLELLCFYGMFDMQIKATGDIEVDIHHLNEDIGITLGGAFKKALKKKNIVRFASNIVPMDGSLVRISLDISGRPCFHLETSTVKKFLGANMLKSVEGYNINYARQFFTAFVNHFPITLHIDILKADDPHHVIEAMFKGVGLCLGQAVKVFTRRKKVSSTKGKI